MIRAGSVLIWDYDGTLYHTLPCIVESILAVQKSRNLLPTSQEDVAEIVGQGGTLEEVFLKLWHVPNNELDFLVSQYRGHYASLSSAPSQPFPEIRSVLEELNKNGVKSIIVSNKGRDALLVSLDRDQLIDYFDLIIGAELGAPKKPDSSIFISLIRPKYPNLSREDFCIVGDTITDYLFAKNCSVKFVWCKYGYGNQTQLRPLVKDIAICSNCVEIPGILSNLSFSGALDHTL